MENKRTSGILLHISSLPSKYGIGTFGEEAYRFVDFLVESKQSYWQILPLTPTGYGDSPYQSFSTFAINQYFIDFDILIKQGLLTTRELNRLSWGEDKSKVSYGDIFISKDIALRKAFARADSKLIAKVKQFEKQQEWLPIYSLFMTIKKLHGDVEMAKWATPYIKKDEKYISRIKKKYANEILYQSFLQYLAISQYLPLKKYANEKGIKIIGDMPIYVSLDSSDVWQAPSNFCLDENLKPIEVAGVPPDYFSATGQLWGNPLYDYENMKKDGYSFWKKRMRHAAMLYDVVRIDHFRGFQGYYSVPYGEETAINGKWNQGVGKELFDEITKDLSVDIIAEDLGVITDDVVALKDALGYPGMRVSCFGFSSAHDEHNIHKPKNYPENCVAYIDTHDNDTLMGYIENNTEALNAFAYYKVKQSLPSALATKMIVDIMKSKANTVILSMQDILRLSSESRMNTPSVAVGNWQFRLKDRNYHRKAAKLKKLVERFNR